MRYLESTVTLSFDPAACNGCRRCVQVCPHAVFAMDAESKRAQVVDRGACMECGACAKNCEVGAIHVRAGVGCAAAVISGKLSGTAPTCGCATGSSGATGCC